MTAIQIDLPDDLAREARRLELLALERLASMIREELQKTSVAETFKRQSAWRASKTSPLLRQRRSPKKSC